MRRVHRLLAHPRIAVLGPPVWAVGGRCWVRYVQRWRRGERRLARNILWRGVLPFQAGLAGTLSPSPACCIPYCATLQQSCLRGRPSRACPYIRQACPSLTAPAIVLPSGGSPVCPSPTCLGALPIYPAATRTYTVGERAIVPCQQPSACHFLAVPMRCSASSSQEARQCSRVTWVSCVGAGTCCPS